jgi:hypothetical protein
MCVSVNVPLGVFVRVTFTILGPVFVVVVTEPSAVRLVLVFLVTISSTFRILCGVSRNPLSNAN